MNNSWIINLLDRFFSFLEKTYDNSIIHKLFLKIDVILVKFSKESGILKIIYKHHDNAALNDSFIYSVTSKIRNKFHNKNEIFVKWILNSKLFGLIFSILPKFERSPFRIIGLFCSTFLLTTIILGFLFLGNVKYLLIKILLLGCFIILSMINISFRRAFRDSFIINFIRKF